MSEPAGRGLSPLGVALLVAAIAVGGWIGLRSQPAEELAPRIDGGAAGIAGIPMRTLDGGLLSLREAHAPTVVMISSETCVYCKAAFREMAAVARGRPLRQLRVLTLEGAAVGAPMLQAAGVTGATLVGPPSPAVGTTLTFQIRGTPTFLFLDARGQVRETLIGYPGSEGLRPWIAVMLGEAPAV
jgi:hypothetical protein